MKELYTIIEEVLAKNKRNMFTFLTGAGISAESGIPTYRGSDGIWVKGSTYHKPEEFGTLKYFLKHPKEVWQYILFRKQMIAGVQPNLSHVVLNEIENVLKDKFQLITQNIDNLHYRAGNKCVYEIHGNYREVKCASGCNKILPFPNHLMGSSMHETLSEIAIESLKCENCGHWLRPNVLLFDEYYDEGTHQRKNALKVAKNTGVLFVIGTSGATNLPIEIARTTLKYGGYVVDINIEDNQFTKLLNAKKRGVILRGKSSDILPDIKTYISILKKQ